ncbi:MAG: hypothetical protein JSR33_10010 [Proteobacteria bacterium]|nr:hypothetical protein [Pseudomonadota bacterium]
MTRGIVHSAEALIKLNATQSAVIEFVFYTRFLTFGLSPTQDKEIISQIINKRVEQFIQEKFKSITRSVSNSIQLILKDTIRRGFFDLTNQEIVSFWFIAQNSKTHVIHLSCSDDFKQYRKSVAEMSLSLSAPHAVPSLYLKREKILDYWDKGIIEQKDSLQFKYISSHGYNGSFKIIALLAVVFLLNNNTLIMDDKKIGTLPFWLVCAILAKITLSFFDLKIENCLTISGQSAKKFMGNFGLRIGDNLKITPIIVPEEKQQKDIDRSEQKSNDTKEMPDEKKDESNEINDNIYSILKKAPPSLEVRKETNYYAEQKAKASTWVTGKMGYLPKPFWSSSSSSERKDSPLTWFNGSISADQQQVREMIEFQGIRRFLYLSPDIRDSKDYNEIQFSQIIHQHPHLAFIGHQAIEVLITVANQAETKHVVLYKVGIPSEDARILCIATRADRHNAILLLGFAMGPFHTDQQIQSVKNKHYTISLPNNSTDTTEHSYITPSH